MRIKNKQVGTNNTNLEMIILSLCKSKLNTINSFTIGTRPSFTMLLTIKFDEKMQDRTYITLSCVQRRKNK